MNTTASRIKLCLSLAFPFIACALQILFWDAIHPFVFLLFYPAVIGGSLLGWVLGGCAATLMSAALVTLFFMGPNSAFAIDQAVSLNYGALAVFAGAGFLTAWTLQLQRNEKKLLATQYELQQALEGASLTAERFRVIFDHSPFGIALSDSNSGKIIEVNNRLADILGRTREDLTCIDWMAITHPDDVQEDLEYITRFNGGEMTCFHKYKRYVRPDGSAVQASLTVVAVKVASGARPQHLAIVQDMSTFMALQLSLAESENQAIQTSRLFQFIFEQAPLGIALVDDKSGLFIQANPAYAKMLGCTPNDLTSIDWISVTHPDDRQANLEEVTHLASGENGIAYVHKRYLRPDGGVVWARLLLSPFVLGKEQNVHLTVAEDITEQKQLEEMLAESHQELRAIFDAADVGLAYVKHRTVIRCNHKLETMLGYPTGGLVGQPTRVWFQDEEQYRTVGQEIYSALHSGKTYPFQLDLTRKDGSSFKCRILAQALVAKDVALGQIGIFEDITEQWQATETLRLANLQVAQANQLLEMEHSKLNSLTQQLSLVKDAAGIGIWTMDLASGKSQWDAQMRRLYGLTPDDQDKEIDYAFWRSFVHPDDWVEKEVTPKNILKQTTRLDEAKEHVYRIILRDGSVRYINARTALENDVSGQPSRMFGINMDVTRHYEQQNALQAAKELAEAANRAKSNFLANMSHEIRTPMNAVINLTELVLDSELTAQQRDYLGNVQDASKHLLAIINDILDYSKIEAGYLRIESIPMRLADVINNTAKLFATKIKKKNLQWSISVAEDVPQQLLGDSLRLGQILNNLVGNAVKFTAHGSIQLTVEPWTPPQQDASSVWVRFSVTDTGIGIASELQDLLFRPFSQADESITRRFGGSGLGLSIVKRLVELMGGNITVTSQLGQGSTFAFTARFGRISQDYGLASLPLSSSPVTEPPITLGNSQQALPTIHNAQILLVEDNKLNQFTACALLKKMHVNVTLANNGVEAIDWVQKKTFAAVLMDLQMPVMGGIEATRHIRTLPAGLNLPIIALTADVMGEVIQNCLTAGMDDHLSKPIDAKQLAALLLKWSAPKGDNGQPSVQR